MPPVSQILAVGLGAAGGAWIRWTLASLLNGLHPRFPIGTWVANLAGGLLIGAAVAWFARQPDLAPIWRLALVTGFLGALTTFSTFSAESLAMLQRGQWAWAFVHASLHLFGCVAAAAAGYRLLA